MGMYFRQSNDKNWWKLERENAEFQLQHYKTRFWGFRKKTADCNDNSAKEMHLCEAELLEKEFIKSKKFSLK